MTILLLLFNTLSAFDSIQVAQSTSNSTPKTCTSFIDVLCEISMVLIALFNVFYVWKLNKSENQDKEVQRKKERKSDMLKTIVLFPNLNKMYSFLDNLWVELYKLKLEGENDKNVDKENLIKQEIEPKIQLLFTSFRSDFIIVINATVPDLGNKIEQISDTMRDTILQNMADPGINLWIPKYFNDKIKSVYEKGKMDMVNALFHTDDVV